MAKRDKKRRPKKKGPAPRRAETAKKKLTKQQIIGITIGVLVIVSMAAGLLISALSSF